MSCDDNPPASLKFSFFFICIIFLMQVVSFATTAWVSTSLNGETLGEEGLWQHCDKIGEYEGCTKVQNYMEHYDVTGLPGWMNAARILQIMGIIFGFATFINTTQNLCSNEIDSHLMLSVIVTVNHFVTSGVLLGSVAAYSEGYKSAVWLKNPSLGGSFVVAAIVASFYALNGAIMIVSVCKFKGVDRVSSSLRRIEDNANMAHSMMVENHQLRMESLQLRLNQHSNALRQLSENHPFALTPEQGIISRVASTRFFY